MGTYKFLWNLFGNQLLSENQSSKNLPN